MILLIDNYDSFTYNLKRYFEELGQEVQVYRHDQLTLGDIERLAPDHIVISPGPSTPNEAGISLNVVSHFAGKVPILGVCLGHQCIGQVYGARIERASYPMHGKTSIITHQGTFLFKNLPNPLRVTRYHSLIIETTTLPSCLEILAETSDKEIMAIRHRHWQVFGVQFHPEAILTESGHQLLQNFLMIG